MPDVRRAMAAAALLCALTAGCGDRTGETVPSPATAWPPSPTSLPRWVVRPQREIREAGSINELALARTGDLLAIPLWTRPPRVRLLRAGDGRISRDIVTPAALGGAVALSPDGQTLAIGFTMAGAFQPGLSRATGVELWS